MVGQAALAGIGHLVMGVRAGVAGVLDDVDEGWLVVALPDSGFICCVGQRLLLGCGAQAVTHGQADTLRHNGPL